MGKKFDRAEGRNVSLYPEEWEMIDRAANERGFTTARGPNTSMMLRQIVRRYFHNEERRPAELESCER